MKGIGLIFSAFFVLVLLIDWSSNYLFRGVSNFIKDPYWKTIAGDIPMYLSALFLLFYVRKFPKNSDEFNLKTLFLFPTILVSVILSISFFGAIEIHFYGKMPTPSEVTGKNLVTSFDLILKESFPSAFTKLALAALLEEMIFRLGMIEVFMRYTKRKWVAVILSSLLFSYIHLGSTLQHMGWFAGGIVFAIAYLKGGIILSFAVHITANTMKVLGDGNYIDPDGPMPIAMAIFLALLVVYTITHGVYLLVNYYKKIPRTSA
jgi:membrane protease YdiL (CAAX protease family)